MQKQNVSIIQYYKCSKKYNRKNFQSNLQKALKRNHMKRHHFFLLACSYWNILWPKHYLAQKHSSFEKCTFIAVAFYPITPCPVLWLHAPLSVFALVQVSRVTLYRCGIKFHHQRYHFSNKSSQYCYTKVVISSITSTLIINKLSE